VSRIELAARETEEEPAMLITSMIDVIFMLLMFFVCFSEVKKSQLPLDLTQVDHAEQQQASETSKPIVVDIDAQDHVFVDGTLAHTDEDLARMIAQAVERLGTDAPVYLSGDRQAKNGTMMRVVSQLSKAGLKRIEFAVQSGG
jgi:biopolymer transport protein ExbD